MNVKRDVLQVLALAALLFSAGCAPVRLLESNDPKIEKGMEEYQEALETFVDRTLLNYERCKLYREEMALLSRMVCEDVSAEVRELCEAEIQADRESVGQSVEKSCSAASYDMAKEGFYIPQQARLSVLKARASLLDSMGVCAAAVNGVAKLFNSEVPSEVQSAVDEFKEGEPANCTEIGVKTVLENHKALDEGHKLIDAKGGDAVTQAELFLPVQRDTLVHNIGIVLFLEEAKKRGDQSQ